MSKASDRAVAWVNHHLPQVAAGEVEPQDVITNILHWNEANADHWNPDAVNEDEAAFCLLVDADRNYQAERGEGDDFANDPTYDEMEPLT